MSDCQMWCRKKNQAASWLTTESGCRSTRIPSLNLAPLITSPNRLKPRIRNHRFLSGGENSNTVICSLIMRIWPSLRIQSGSLTPRVYAWRQKPEADWFWAMPWVLGEFPWESLWVGELKPLIKRPPSAIPVLFETSAIASLSRLFCITKPLRFRYCRS